MRVPAAEAVGEENRGWYIGATLLDFERSASATAVGVRKQLERLVALRAGQRDKLAIGANEKA